MEGVRAKMAALEEQLASSQSQVTASVLHVMSMCSCWQACWSLHPLARLCSYLLQHCKTACTVAQAHTAGLSRCASIACVLHTHEKVAHQLQLHLKLASPGLPILTQPHTEAWRISSQACMQVVTVQKALELEQRKRQADASERHLQIQASLCSQCANQTSISGVRRWSADHPV